MIDFLVGFEMALVPGFRMDFRESLYRMISALTAAGVTIFTIVEIEDTSTAVQFKLSGKAGQVRRSGQRRQVKYT